MTVECLYYNIKTGFKNLAFVRGQGVDSIQKTKAYMLVRVDFESDGNTAIGQKIRILKPV